MSWITISVSLLAVHACSSADDDPIASANDDAGSSGRGDSSGSPAAGASARAGAGSAGHTSAGSSTSFGEKYEGGEFHLGPVDWDESQWHNACAPGGGYAPEIRALEGDLLAGLWVGIPDVSRYCDACIAVTTARGKSATLRVVTYGETTANSIDVSPEAFELLDSGEYPRSMTWQFAACAQSGPVQYEFQTGSSQWWTSFWVRNARLPLAKVEVKGANHDSFVELERGGDGTLTDGGGFGEGAFTLRLTAIDGSQHVDELAWPAGGIAGKLIAGRGNF
jgi:expansin (peptidoglycan-binding protein)